MPKGRGLRRGYRSIVGTLLILQFRLILYEGKSSARCRNNHLTAIPLTFTSVPCRFSPIWNDMAGVVGFEPTDVGVKVPCLNQLGYTPVKNEIITFSSILLFL